MALRSPDSPMFAGYAHFWTVSRKKRPPSRRPFYLVIIYLPKCFRTAAAETPTAWTAAISCSLVHRNSRHQYSTSHCSWMLTLLASCGLFFVRSSDIFYRSFEASSTSSRFVFIPGVSGITPQCCGKSYRSRWDKGCPMVFLFCTLKHS